MAKVQPACVSYVRRFSATASGSGRQRSVASSKRFLTVASDDKKMAASMDVPPLDEPLSGYIFVCNNESMDEDLKRHLFGTKGICFLEDVGGMKACSCTTATSS